VYSCLVEGQLLGSYFGVDPEFKGISGSSSESSAERGLLGRQVTNRTQLKSQNHRDARGRSLHSWMNGRTVTKIARSWREEGKIIRVTDRSWRHTCPYVALKDSRVDRIGRAISTLNIQMK
jgi:hypothetical protein